MYNRGIKIALAGSACSGKTTLAAALRKEYPQFDTPLEAVRFLVKNYGYDIHSGNSSLQLSVLYLESSLLTDKNNYILDGAELGSLSYTQYYRNHGNCDMDEGTFAFYKDVVKKQLLENTDLIIFLRSGEFPVEDDGFRVTDPDYIKEVDSIVEKFIEEMNLEDKVISPKGSVKERVEFCKPFIDKLLKEDN